MINELFCFIQALYIYIILYRSCRKIDHLLGNSFGIETTLLGLDGLISWKEGVLFL